MRLIVPHVRMIHSLASESALRELERHVELARPGLRVLLEVNIAGEPGKAGIAPERDRRLRRARARAGHGPHDDAAAVAARAGQPPLVRRAARARRASMGCEQLSMGTSQDYVVAVEEGATVVRIGTSLYR